MAVHAPPGVQGLRGADASSRCWYVKCKARPEGKIRAGLLRKIGMEPRNK